MLPALTLPIRALLSSSTVIDIPRMRWIDRISLQFMGLFVACSLMAGCAGGYHRPGPVISEYPQRGVASWYGPSFHGNPTANGEPYDMWALTAAHRTLPFGTRVLVQSVNTGKTVAVRINDRGPFIRGRVIDLSYGAARELAMIGKGTEEVILTILDSPGSGYSANSSNKMTENYWVQVGDRKSVV